MTQFSELKLQLIISGIGGQGVLFVTRLLAEAALQRGHAVLASETHGMAQRGGTVISHLKIGAFAGPLIRPGQADGLITLHAENLPFHAGFLASHGWAVANCGSPPAEKPAFELYPIDAGLRALRLGRSKSANLITLGFAAGYLGHKYALCSLEDLKTGLVAMGTDQKRQEAGCRALEAGFAGYQELVQSERKVL